MEAKPLPPGQTVSPSVASDSLESAGANVPVANLSGAPEKFPTERGLEVHSEGQAGGQTITAPTMRSVPFSRRRATIVSLVITLVVLAITGVTAALFINRGATRDNGVNSNLNIPEQDVSVGDESAQLPELEGVDNALLVNGNIIARGNLEVVSGNFTSVLRTSQLSGDQELILPDASGTICLDINNCNFATQDQIAQDTAQITEQGNELAEQAAALAALQAQLNQLVIPPAGVTSLNDQAGAVSIQGTLNQISVSTANGVITLTTPQNLDANANVQFNNLTLGGQLSTNTLQQTAPGNDVAINAGNDDIIFTVGGRTFQLPTSGPGAQTICTTAVGCGGGGGGSVDDVNGLTGSITLQGTTDQVTVTTGVNTITFSTPQNINTTSSPTFAGLTLTTALGVASGGTGIATVPTNGQLLIGNGTGYTLATLGNGGGLSITNGAGSISLAVNYGSTANTAVQGNTALVCASGVGNLSGGGNAVTLGAGGSCNNISIINNPTFSTSVTTPSLILTGAGSNGSLQVANLGQATTYTLPDPGQASVDICLSTGNCAGAGGGITGSGTTNTIPLFTGSQAIGNSIITQSGTTINIGGSLTLTNALTVGNGGTGGTTFTSNGVIYGNGTGALQATAAPTAGQVLLGNGSGIPTFITLSGDVTVNGTGVTVISPNSVALGVDTTGDYVANLGILTGLSTTGNSGEGSTPTLSVLYGSTANTAVQGNTALTCPSGTGNLTGGGTGITLGTGGACASLSTVQNPTFTTSVTTPNLILTGVGNSGTLEVANLGQATTYTLPDPGQATADICLSTGNCVGGGGSAPNNAEYLVVTLNGTLSNERALAAGSNITFTDGGANNNFTLATVQNPTFNTSVTTPLLTSAGALNITPGGALTVGATGQTTVLQGSTTSITSNGAGNDITLTSADQVIVNSTGTIELQDNTNITGALAVTGSVTGGTYNGQTISSAASFTGMVSVATSLTTPLLQSTGALNITPGGALTVGVAGQTALLQGSTLTLTSNGAGNDITLTSADQIILNAAGTIELQDSTNITGNLAATGTGSFQGASVSIGGAAQQGSLILNDGSSNTGTLQLAALGQNTVYNLPDPGQASVDICLTTGNCAGSGGGITGSGTTNRVAKFTGSGTIGDSTITDDGTNVSITGDFTLQGGDITVGTSSQIGSLALHDGNGQTTTVRGGDSTGNLVFILPTAAGATNQCIKQSGTASQLYFDNCDGGGGGSSATLQQAYNNGSTINTTNARDIAFTLSNDTTDSNFVVTIADDATGNVQIVRVNGTGTNNPAQLLLLDNQDASQVIADGLRIQSAGGGITDALDVSDAELVNALNVGDNTILGTTAVIDFTNFDVLANGNTSVGGTLSVTGAVTGGTYNGQTISSAASLTGTLSVAGATTLQSTLAVQGASATIGGAAQQGSLILNDGSSNIGTLQTTALGQNTVYSLPDPGQATADICLSTGNCVGGSGGAPNNAEYLVVSLNGTLTNERALAAGANIAFTDGGAGGSFGVATIQNPTFTTSVTTPSLLSSGALSIASAGAGNDITVDGADQFIVQDVSVFNEDSIFNNDVDAVFTDLENLSIGSTVTSTNSVSVINALMTNNSSSGTQTLALLQNAAGTGTTEGLLTLNNADPDTAVDVGVAITGIVTTGIDVSDPAITNALLFGANDIIGTNFTVAGASGAVTGGTYNGQTISSTASFTGTLSVAGATTLQSTLAVQGPSATIGGAAQQGSLILNDGNGQTATISVGSSLVANTALAIPTTVGASDTFCLLTLANCAGAGGGVTTAGGTANRLTMFTGTQTVGNSWFLQNGSTLELDSTRNLSLLGGNLSVTGNTDVNGNFTITSAASGSRIISGRFNYDSSGTGAATYFQTSEVNDDTLLSLVANGTGTTTGVVLYGNGFGDSHGIVEYESGVGLNLTATNELSNGGGSINLITKPGGGGSNTTRLSIDENGLTNFNPTGTDSDFIIEGDNDANLFYVDASTDRIGIGDATPAATLTVGSGDLFQVAGATGNVTTAGDIAVNGGDLTSSASTLNINAGSTIALQDNTTIAGTLGVTGPSATIGGAAQQGSLILNDGNGQTATISVGSALVANTALAIPTAVGASDTFCLLTLANCGAAGVSTIGTINSQTKSANGAVITGTSLVMQTADATFPGLVSTGTQSFAGAKTFTGNTTLGDGAGDILTITGTAVSLSNNLNFDSNTLFIDSTANTVSIGSASNDVLLKVTGSQPAQVSGDGTNAMETFRVEGGTGGDTTGTTGQTAGFGGDVNLFGGNGGEAPSGSENGSGGSVFLQGGTPGQGAGSAGTWGGVNLQLDGGGTGIGLVSNEDVALRAGNEAIGTATGKQALVAEKVHEIGSAETATSVSDIALFSLNGNIDTNGDLLGGGGSGTAINIVNSNLNFNLNTGTTIDAVVNGYAANVLLEGTGGVMDAYRGFYAGTPVIDGTTVVTDAYGLYIDEIDSASITNAYGIYQAGANDINVINGLTQFNGNVDLGNATGDTITFTGRVDSHIIPSADDTYDLGSVTNRWRDVYVGPASLHIGTNGDEGTLSYNTATNTFEFNQAISTPTFRSDTATFGVASTTNGVLTLQNATNAFTVSINAPNQTVGNATISLPDTAGANDTFCLLTLNNCGGGGVTTIGTIDSQTKSANGAVISGTSLVLQTADVTFPGLVNTGTQTFAGAKTFNGVITAAAAGTGLSVTNNASVGGNLAVTGTGTFTGDVAVNGGDLTATGALNITPSGTLTLGVTGQAAILQGSTATVTSNGAGNDITLTSADEILINSAGATVINEPGNAVNFRVESDSNANMLFVDGTNNRIGIGNAAPAATLEVTGDIYLTKEANRTIKLADSTTASTAGGNLSILGATGGSEAVGGDITIQAGAGGTTGTVTLGGDVNILAGNTQGFGIGGHVNLTAGGGILGGTITLNGGGGFGKQGDVLLQNSDPNSHVGIGIADADGRLELGGNMTLDAWGFNGAQLQSSSATYTDNNTAASGTATNAVINSFGTPSLNATNSGVTFTNAANVYIQGAPTLAGGSNDAITNAYSLWVDDGTTRLDHSSTSVTAGTERALQVTMADTGVVTTGTDTTYGQQISLTRSGPTGGTINNIGLDISVTGTTGGTSTNTGLNVNVTGADTNYAAIFQGGNVGIGDVTPAATFTVGNGDLFQVAGATGNTTTSGDVAVNGGDLTSTAAALNITTSHASGTIALRTNSVTRLTVSNSSVTSSVPFLAPDGQDFAPGIGFSADTDTGFYRPGADLLAVVTAGAERVRFGNTYRVEIQSSSGVEIMNSGSALDLDIASREGIKMHLDEDDDDTGERFDIVTDAGASTIFSVIESADRGVVFIQGWLRLGAQDYQFTTTQTLEPLASYVEATCNTGGGCTLSFNDATSSEGQTLFLVSNGANTITVNDVDGQQELSATPFVMGQYDTLMLIYTGDRWVEYSRSDNEP